MEGQQAVDGLGEGTVFQDRDRVPEGFRGEIKRKEEGCGLERSRWGGVIRTPLSRTSTHSFPASDQVGSPKKSAQKWGFICVVGSREGLQVSTKVGGRSCQAAG